MGFPKKYFTQEPNSPSPLQVTIRRRVRFEEVDSLEMVWHGRYPSYFEDGRIAFGDRYGLSYQSFRENRTMAPIVQMHFDYRVPLRFDDFFEIETELHWTDAMRLNFSYTLRKKTEVVATGYTVQLLADEAGNVLLIPPPWLVQFRQEWQEGTLKNLEER